MDDRKPLSALNVLESAIGFDQQYIIKLEEERVYHQDMLALKIMQIEEAKGRIHNVEEGIKLLRDNGFAPKSDSDGDQE